jgi:hypothetical protein
MFYVELFSDFMIWEHFPWHRNLLLKINGFKHRKTNDGYKFLKEREEIVAA